MPGWVASLRTTCAAVSCPTFSTPALTSPPSKPWPATADPRPPAATTAAPTPPAAAPSPCCMCRTRRPRSNGTHHGNAIAFVQLLGNCEGVVVTLRLAVASGVPGRLAAAALPAADDQRRQRSTTDRLGPGRLRRPAQDGVR